MTKKDLFRIILKLFGLYLMVSSLVLLAQIIMSLFYSYLAEMSIISLILLIASVIASYILLFKTDVLINLFKLDKGFDNDEVALNQFSSTSIIQLGLVIISLYFIIASIPDVLTNVFYAFKTSIPHNTMENLFEIMAPTQPNYYVLTNSLTSLLLGILILMNKNLIASKIEKLN